MTKDSEIFSKQKHDHSIDGSTEARDKFNSIRPNGSINSRPQERMRNSNPQQ